MNFIVLKKNSFFYYFENIKSDNLGFCFSFFIHFTIILFAIGVPNFFEPKPINLPTIIPIEIVNISDITSISKEIKETKIVQNKKITVTIKEKKFNSSNNTEIKKMEIKKKPKIKNDLLEKKIISKQDIVIREKKESILKLEKEKMNIDINSVESLPTKKIIPKLKPKPEKKIINQKKLDSDIVIKNQPKPKPKPEFNIASMLKDLRNDKLTTKIDADRKNKKEIKIDLKNDNISKENSQLSISEIDLLRQQLSSCWNAPAGAVIEKGMVVKISAKIKSNRTIFENSVRIIDTNIPKSNSFYGPITESAMRTLLNPECIPLKLPKEKYQLWKKLTITFDYSIMKGY